MADLQIRLDLRDVPVENIEEAVGKAGDHVGFLMTAWQWTAWQEAGGNGGCTSRTVVMVPDFLYYARLASTGQAKQIVKLPGSLSKVFFSGLRNVRTHMGNVPGLATGNFWAAAETLTAYDMGLLPNSFAGEVLLQYNLADFTWLFDQRSYMKKFVSLASGFGGWGVATQQLSKALTSCARWELSPNRIMYTSGSGRLESDLLTIAKLERFANTQFMLDMTQWPKELICSEDIGNLRREYDSEWLMDYETGMCFLKEIFSIN